MGLSKRVLDDLNRTEPSEYEPERPEYSWPDESLYEEDCDHAGHWFEIWGED